MSGEAKRCQITLEDDEFADIERIAGRRNMTVEQWIEETVRLARSDYHARVRRIEKVIKETSQLNFPTADIEQMLQEIEAGRRIQ